MEGQEKKIGNKTHKKKIVQCKKKKKLPGQMERFKEQKKYESGTKIGLGLF